MKPGPQIKSAAVLGAGTMGVRIAAHLANAGVHCWLLDIAPSELTPEEEAFGLRIRQIAQGFDDDFHRHWAGTHFFKPPRYMKLVALIPGPGTSAEVLEVLAEFCDRRLGKGVVRAKVTPNFIASRVGTFSMLTSLSLMARFRLSIEEVWACAGPAIRCAQSATFRTTDTVC